MPARTGDPNVTHVGYQHQSKKGYIVVDQFAAPIAPGNTNILAAQTLPASGTTVLISFVAQPDLPRVVRIKGNASGIAGNVVVVGKDIRGNTVTDTIALSGASAVDGVIAMASVTSITLPAKTNSSGDTVSVGFGAALGRSRIMVTDKSILTVCDTAQEGTKGTFAVDPTIGKNTVTFNTTPNGTHNFDAVYATIEMVDAA